MSKISKIAAFPALTIIMTFSLMATSAQALQVGDTVSSPQLRDSSDLPSLIPDLGKKVMCFFYADPDFPDQNDPAAEAIKAQNFPQDRYRGVGIAQTSRMPHGSPIRS
jgi:predicted transcriptional regulator